MIIIPFERNDGGRSTSARPKQRNDCAVRACAILTGIDYDIIYDEFALMGRRCSKGTSRGIWVDFIEGDHGAVRHAFPAVKGERRMNPETFVTTYRTGRWLVQEAGHVYAVIDGVVHDMYEPRHGRCIYSAWLFP